MYEAAVDLNKCKISISELRNLTLVNLNKDENLKAKFKSNQEQTIK
jgi:hypothetical protein